MTRIAILGGGSWGTALSVVLSRTRKPHAISLWVHNAALAESLHLHRENTAYLPGVALPASIQVTHDYAEALAGVQIVVGAMPSVHARATYSQALPHLGPETIFVSATKGLEPATRLRMSRLIAQLLTQATSATFSQQIAVLSGPSFAAETARNVPTAVVVASEEPGLAARLQEEFASSALRLYSNDDVLGVELAGAMKNVIAIAAGVCHGLDLGSNSLAALITRGLAEMSRLAVALGGRSETLSGLAGLGDLVLTCNGALSRNRHVGVELGKGRSLTEILANMRMIAEGVDTAAPLLELAREQNIELPITEQVAAILRSGKPPREAICEIMERPLRKE